MSIATRAFNAARNRVNQRYIRRVLGRVHGAALASHDYAPRIKAIVSNYRSEGGLAHDFQEYKLLSLWELLERKKPSSILELGTGTTSEVFLDYIGRMPESQLTCVDESERWGNRVKQRIAREIATRVRVSTEKRVAIDGLPFVFRYEHTPPGPYDFVFVDGPSLFIGPYNVKVAINNNVLDCVRENEPLTIVVDGRFATVAFLRDVLLGYDLHESDLIPQKYQLGYNYFSVFSRRA